MDIREEEQNYGDLSQSWINFLQSESMIDHLFFTINAVDQLRQSQTIFPKKDQVFRGLNLVNPSNVRVVIIGQDPYHGVGQANGLAFSVARGVKIPPSLANVYKELNRDLGVDIPGHGDLECWARQGVLLLNATLTVAEAKPGSHAGVGWQTFTDEIIISLSRLRSNLIFMLWGNFARSKSHLIDRSNHLVLESVHPSPLSAHRGFIGCGHFSKANDYLKECNAESIHWDCL